MLTLRSPEAPGAWLSPAASRAGKVQLNAKSRFSSCSPPSQCHQGAPKGQVSWPVACLGQWLAWTWTPMEERSVPREVIGEAVGISEYSSKDPRSPELQSWH